ncbi:MAG: DUF134 domain-containing protein [Erysipelotrichaceae bacterium]|nr:DUF134 domain-containing protein [Erysipelotrichaceae bacterium]MDD4642287.1 DUF134 domain-containing protein [Erysipelotrichaceae bacterium]
MARPRKWRRVCRLPNLKKFGPTSDNERKGRLLMMSVEEYETIRLIDHEDLTQEECALQMNIARTTVQKIYNDARIKVAASLVDGLTLIIGGGDYQLCNGNNQYCHNGSCVRRNIEQEK